MKQLFIINIFIVISISLHGQFTYFNNRYNNDIWSSALTILETDSGYTICGVGGQESNGFIFHRIVLTSIDQLGNQKWWKSYGEDYHEYYAGLMRSCIKTSDGGYAVSGSITDSIRDVGLLMKFNQNGDSLWSKIYGDTVSTEYTGTFYYVCQQLPDNGYILCGLYYVDSYDWDVLLTRTDSLGNVIWSNTYGDLNRYEVGYSIAQLPQGDLLIGLNKQSYGNNYSSDPGLLKVDSLGNKLWMKYYGGDYNDGQAQVLLSQDGNYLVGSVYAVNQTNPYYPEHKAWIFKTDTSGNVLWERLYGDLVFFGWCSSINELEDASIVISGTGAFSGIMGSYGWILKTLQNGDSIWMRRYYSYYPTFDNNIYDTRITSDNGIINTGMTLGDPDWEQSIWVQKLDSIGCDSVRCDTTVGVSEEHGGMEAWGHGSLKIWPNPASDWIHIVSRASNLSWHSERYAEIYNIIGEKVGEFKMPMIYGSNDYNVSNLPEGLYLLVIKERQNVVYTRKFLIAR